MQVISQTEMQKNLDTILDAVCKNREDIVVYRKNNENVIIMSLDDHNAYRETFHLLANPKNRDRLLSSLKHARENKLFQKDIIG